MSPRGLQLRAGGEYSRDERARSQSRDPADRRPPLTEQGAAEFQEAVGRIAGAVNGFIQGKAEVVDLALVCLLAEGHLLLEDVPGVGKTSLARSSPLARYAVAANPVHS